jgi:hypothetical protein
MQVEPEASDVDANVQCRDAISVDFNAKSTDIKSNSEGVQNAIIKIQQGQYWLHYKHQEQEFVEDVPSFHSPDPLPITPTLQYSLQYKHQLQEVVDEVPSSPDPPLRTPTFLNDSNIPSKYVSVRG